MNDETELSVLELEENLADVEKPPEVPPGQYIGEIQGITDATSAKGNAYWNVKFLVPPEELPATVREHYEDGAVFYWNRTIKPKDRRGLYNLRKFIEAIGLNSNVTTIDPNEWMGCRAKLVVVMGKDLDGQPRSEVKSLLPVDVAPARKAAAAAPAKARGARR